MRAGSFALLVALLVLLVGAGCYAYIGLIGAEEPLPPDGIVAVTIGIFFSVIVGCGLMGLLF